MQSSFLSLHTLDVLKHRLGKKLPERCDRISRRGWWCWLIIKAHLSYRLRSFTKSSRWFNVVGDPLENIFCIDFVTWIFRNWNEKILLPSVRWVICSSTQSFKFHRPDFVRCPCLSLTLGLSFLEGDHTQHRVAAFGSQVDVDDWQLLTFHHDWH